MTATRLPILIALRSQIIAAALLLGLSWLYGRQFHAGLPVPALILLQGGLAAAIGVLSRLPRWWAAINLLLPFAIWAALAWQLPAWIYLAAFIALLTVFWNSSGDRVPLYLSNRATWAALAELLPEKPGIRFADLGCGLGGTLVYLSARRPDGEFTGVESAPLPALLSWLRLLARRNARLVRADLWRHDLSSYDVVYCFLSPVPMPQLHEKARREMRPGSLLISNSFEVPGAPPDETVQLGDRRRTRLLIWRM